MPKITKEEVVKIAGISHIELQEHEIEPLVQQLQAVLTYAARVQDIASSTSNNKVAATNVFRDDVVIPTDPESILRQAPEVEEHYFVVPRILESNQ